MRNTRNASIELLRVIAMFMIVLLHLLGKTSAINEIDVSSWVYIPVWTMEAICKTGNCLFVLITGYFYEKFSFKFEKVLKLWMQVYFYSVGGAIVAKYILGYELLSGWREVLMPVVKREYWFITVYIGLYCFLPWINILINHMTDALWCKLLCVGAYIKKNEKRFCEMFQGKKVLLGLLVLLLPLGKYAVEWLKTISVSHYLVDRWIEELFCSNSPVLLLASVLIFICFLQINIKSESKCGKIVNFLGKGCIGVYLIHNNRNIARHMWEGLRINYWLVECKNLIVILGIAIGVFVVCNLLDHIREYVFEKFYINKICKKISNFVTSLYLNCEALIVGKLQKM